MSSSSCGHFGEKYQRYHLQQGHGVPSKVEGGDHCDSACTLQYWKIQKLDFSCFIEEILAKFVLYAIYFDESHA